MGHVEFEILVGHQSGAIQWIINREIEADNFTLSVKFTLVTVQL